MGEAGRSPTIILGEERAPMLDSLLLLSFCVLMGLLSLAVCVWVAVSGSLLTLDGILMVLISLTLGGIFLGNFAWSIRSGEVRQLLNNLLKKPDSSDTSSKPPPG